MLVILLQLTRNNFPAHLIALWQTFNVSSTLIDGFKKTGLFPFAPEIILATVKPIGQQMIAAPASPTISPQKRKIREALVEMNVNDEEAKSVLDHAERAARGKSLGYDIAKSFQAALLNLNPIKKRKSKDFRLNTETGLILTASDVIMALEEKAANKAKMLKASAEKAKKKSAEIGKKVDVVPKKPRGRPRKFNG